MPEAQAPLCNAEIALETQLPNKPSMCITKSVCVNFKGKLTLPLWLHGGQMFNFVQFGGKSVLSYLPFSKF